MQKIDVIEDYDEEWEEDYEDDFSFLMKSEYLSPYVFKSLNFHIDNLNEFKYDDPYEIWWKCEKGHASFESISNHEGYFYCRICEIANDSLFGDVGTKESDIQFDEETGFFYSENKDMVFCTLSFLVEEAKMPEGYIISFSNELIIPIENILNRHKKDAIRYRGKFVWACNECGDFYNASLEEIRDRGYNYSTLYGLCFKCNKDNLIPGFNDIRFISSFMYTPDFSILKESAFDLSKNLKPINFYSSFEDEEIYWTCYNSHTHKQKASEYLIEERECSTCSIPMNTFMRSIDYMQYDKINDYLAEWDFQSNVGINPYSVKDDTQVWWKCSSDPVHPIFNKSIKHMAKNRRCPYCTEEILISGNNDIATKYPEIVKLFKPTLNPGIDLTKMVSVGNHSTLLLLECNQGHIIEETFSKLKTVIKCRDCQGGLRAGNSWIQLDFCKEIQLFLPGIQGLKGDLKTQIYWGDKKTLRVDMVDYSSKIIIEYDGKYFHSGLRSGKSYQHHLDVDRSKTEAMLEAGYRVIRIRENDLKHINLEDSNLYQINHKNGSSISLTVKKISEWLSEFK